jgi:hypothetical protein
VRVTEEYDLALREKDEHNLRLERDIEQLRRRPAQRPAELQGTVQELALDERISARCPHDHVRRVARGRPGADLVQTERSPGGWSSGLSCGSPSGGAVRVTAGAVCVRTATARPARSQPTTVPRPRTWLYCQAFTTLPVSE